MTSDVVTAARDAFARQDWRAAHDALAGSRPELSTADLELLAARLSDDATVVVERSSRSPEPAWPGGIELERRRDYGDTTLWWARSGPSVG